MEGMPLMANTLDLKNLNPGDSVILTTPNAELELYTVVSTNGVDAATVEGALTRDMTATLMLSDDPKKGKFMMVIAGARPGGVYYYPLDGESYFVAGCHVELANALDYDCESRIEGILKLRKIFSKNYPADHLGLRPYGEAKNIRESLNDAIKPIQDDPYKCIDLAAAYDDVWTRIYEPVEGKIRDLLWEAKRHDTEILSRMQNTFFEGINRVVETSKGFSPNGANDFVEILESGIYPAEAHRFTVGDIISVSLPESSYTLRVADVDTDSAHLEDVTGLTKATLALDVSNHLTLTFADQNAEPVHHVKYETLPISTFSEEAAYKEYLKAIREVVHDIRLEANKNSVETLFQEAYDALRKVKESARKFNKANDTSFHLYANHQLKSLKKAIEGLNNTYENWDNQITEANDKAFFNWDDE